MSLILDCPIPGCDTLPWTDARSLAEHLAEHDTPAAPPAPTPPAPTPPVSDTVRSFSPGGTRASRVSGRPDAEPDRPLPFCRWTRNGSDWVIRGPLASLRAGTTVTVEKANGERKRVDIDPTSITPDARTRYDRCDMGLARPAPKAKATPAAPALALEHGRVYAAADGTFIKVTESKAGSLYGKVLDDDGKFTIYRRGLLNDIARHLTAEEAADFGHMYKRCVFCARKLSDENRSVLVGYGPDCAEKYGLPWG